MKDIIAGNVTGKSVSPPMMFWTGIVRIDEIYFQNQSQKITLHEESEFLPAIVSGHGYRIAPGLHQGKIIK